MSCFTAWLKKIITPKSVAIPPGHKVVVVHGGVPTSLGKLESGIWVADFGQIPDGWQLFDEIKNKTAQIGRTSIVWVIQEQSFGGLEGANQPEIINRFKLVREWFPNIGQPIVFVQKAGLQAHLLSSLQALGFGVHYSAEDGACLVEVHKPDGTITIGMPGPAFKPKA